MKRAEGAEFLDHNEQARSERSKETSNNVNISSRELSGEMLAFNFTGTSRRTFQPPRGESCSSTGGAVETAP